MDEEVCPMCDGCGEIEAATIQDIGPVGCPQCIETEKDERIAELEAALRSVDAIAWCADSVAEVRERVGERLSKVLPKG